jgi:hypothetical protein
MRDEISRVAAVEQVGQVAADGLRRHDRVHQAQLGADALELRVVDPRDHPAETQGPPHQRGDDVGLVGIGQAEQEVRRLGAALLEDVRVGSVAVDEPAVHLLGQLVDPGPVALHDHDLVAVRQGRPGRGQGVGVDADEDRAHGAALR